jgi:hypothetical protein
MNEFTKEELKDLILFVDGGIRHNSHAVELRNKIKSMIDDYCEHENQSSISDADYVYFCQDCNVITGI